MRVRNISAGVVRGWLWPKRVVIPVDKAAVVDDNNGQILLKLGLVELDDGSRPAPAPVKSKPKPPPNSSARRVVKKKVVARKSGSKLKEALR